MALFEHHTDEYRTDFKHLYNHLKRVSENNEVCMEFVIEDLISKNLRDY